MTDQLVLRTDGMSDLLRAAIELVQYCKGASDPEIFPEEARLIAAAETAIENAQLQPQFDLRVFSAENLMRCTSSAGFGHPLDMWSLSDWMTAALGELGEAANVVKKLNRVRDGITGNVRTEAELRQDLADELADAFIYLDLLSQAAAIDLPKAIREKFDRTSARIGYVATSGGRS